MKEYDELRKAGLRAATAACDYYIATSSRIADPQVASSFKEIITAMKVLINLPEIDSQCNGKSVNESCRAFALEFVSLFRNGDFEYVIGWLNKCLASSMTGMQLAALKDLDEDEVRH